MVRLCGVLEDTGKVAYTKSEILSDEESTNIESGKIVAAIGLDLMERISLKIDDGLSMTSIEFADILTELFKVDRVSVFIISHSCLK